VPGLQFHSGLYSSIKYTRSSLLEERAQTLHPLRNLAILQETDGWIGELVIDELTMVSNFDRVMPQDTPYRSLLGLAVLLTMAACQGASKVGYRWFVVRRLHELSLFDIVNICTTWISVKSAPSDCGPRTYIAYDHVRVVIKSDRLLNDVCNHY